MPEEQGGMSPHVSAVLAEICGALEQLNQTGQGHTLFINKMALSQQDRRDIHDFLGEGSVRIKLEKTDEPAEWLESGIIGVWFGVFYDHAANPVLETIEITHFPQVAAAQPEDIVQAVQKLQNRLK